MLAFSMKISPSTSPIEAHHMTYLDYDFDFKPHMMTTTLPFLASNLRISACDSGFEVMLDRPIGIDFMVAEDSRKYVLQAKIENLGSAIGKISGDLNNGNVQLTIEHMGAKYGGEIQTHCDDLEKCSLAGKFDIPDQHPIGKFR